MLLCVQCLGEDVLADENMDRLCEDCGLRAASSWKVFKILSKPGTCARIALSSLCYVRFNTVLACN